MALLTVPLFLAALFALAFPIAALTSEAAYGRRLPAFAKSLAYAFGATFVWFLCAKIGADINDTGGQGVTSLIGAAEGFFVGGLIGAAAMAGVLHTFVRSLKTDLKTQSC